MRLRASLLRVYLDLLPLPCYSSIVAYERVVNGPISHGNQSVYILVLFDSLGYLTIRMTSRRVEMLLRFAPYGYGIMNM